MNSAISISFSSTPSPSKSHPFTFKSITVSPFSTKPLSSSRQLPSPCCSRRNLHNPSAFRLTASSNQYLTNSKKSEYLQGLKNLAAATIFLGVSIAGATHKFPARAEPQAPTTAAEQNQKFEQEKPSPLSEFLETNEEALNALKSLLQQKLENKEDEEALRIVKRLVEAQPEEKEWKFLLARLSAEVGDTQGARKVFDEILERDPLSFEALFENALLMDKCGEGEIVITRLEEALRIAEEHNKLKEARDVKLIIAQMKFLQKNVDEALRSYQELAKEDPTDFRPYFCQGMIYSLLDKNAEAKEQFAKFHQLSPKKFEVEGFLRTPLSKMKLFGNDEGN